MPRIQLRARSLEAYQLPSLYTKPVESALVTAANPSEPKSDATSYLHGTSSLPSESI